MQERQFNCENSGGVKLQHRSRRALAGRGLARSRTRPPTAVTTARFRRRAALQTARAGNPTPQKTVNPRFIEHKIN